jgi:hypothetical protein
MTPRGTIKLLQQGDYYVEAGSTEDPTRLGVRSGAAQIASLGGQVLAVRPGEVGEVLGEGGTLQLRTIRTAPPAPAAYWANRDRQIVYEQPQYLPAGVTGYEDLNAYGYWSNDATYGRVWAPRAVPAGWAPYRTGHWSYVEPWGWTWIDEQPWGFAPYHYGRWAETRGRWVWIPPQREVHPVYAPALVAFVGGVELATLARTNNAPVGWFPLGPREVYVPPYTTNRDYYRRINRSARIEDRTLEDRWQRAERREAFAAANNKALMNQRFATVVPTSAFVRSQPVMRSALRVQPQTLAAAPVAPVSAPPAPTASVANAAAAPAPAQQQAPLANVPVARTAIANMPALARPAAVERPTGPGPKFATTQPRSPTDDKATQAPPALAPRQGPAPPVLRGAVTPAPTQPGKPGEPPRQQQAAPQPQAVPPPPASAKPAEPARPQAAPQLPARQQARPAEPARPPQAAPAPQQQARPPEPQRQPQGQSQQTRPQQRQAVPPAMQPQQQVAPSQRQAAPPSQQPRQAAPVQQQQQAPPPQPRQAAPSQQPQAQPSQQRAAPPPQPAPQPRQAAPMQQQRQAQPPQQRAAPPPQAAPQQRQAAPAPQQAQSPQAQQQRQAPQQKPDDNKK